MRSHRGPGVSARSFSCAPFLQSSAPNKVLTMAVPCAESEQNSIGVKVTVGLSDVQRADDQADQLRI